MRVVQVVIDESTPRLITGVYEFDRDSGGSLIIPAGTSFPGTPAAKELFWRTDESKLYRRNDGGTAWDAVAAAAVAHATSHKHGGSDEVATATAAADAIPKAGATGKLAIGWFPTGTSATDVCIGNDARLSDARTPTAHASSHNAGGGDALAIDAAAGTGSLRTLGTSATSACAGNDARLSDARAPTAHAASHNAGGGDALAIDAAAGTGSLRTLGTSATSACAGNDSRLSNARTPTAHATSHQPGGSDAMAIDAAAGTGSLRTLGTSATSACAGNDARLNPYVNSGVSEAESSTTSGTYQTKLTVTQTYTSGVRYRIDYQFEIGATGDTDADYRVTIGGTTVMEGTFRNYPYATRRMAISGFYFSTSLSGSVSTVVQYAMGYGGTAYIRRARVFVMRVD